MKYYYGTNADSRVYSLERPGAVRVWALHKIEDLAGNYYEIRYEKDQNEIYPIKIIYTQGPGITRFRAIEFIYNKNRPDTVKNRDSVMTWRLEEVRVKSGITDIAVLDWFVGKLIRNYQIQYTLTADSKRSQINWITHTKSQRWGNATSFAYGATGTQAGFAAYLFGNNQLWSNTNQPYFTGDVNGDGLSDIIRVGNNGQNHVYLSKPGGGNIAPVVSYSGKNNWDNTNEPIFIADINLDGKADILRVSKTSCQNHVMLGKSDGTFSPAITSACPRTENWTTDNGNPVIRDMNGDGSPDIIFAGRQKIYVIFSDRTGLYTEITESDAFKRNDGNEWTLVSEPALPLDMNGDSKVDLLRVGTDGNLYVLYSDGVNFIKETNHYFSYSGRTDWISLQANLMIGDIDGDGRIDLARSAPNGNIYTMLSLGHGKFSPAITTKVADGYNVGDNGTILLDVNHDGRADFVHAGQNGIISFIPAKADGTFEYQLTGNLSAGTAQWSNSTEPYKLADIDGDGRPDIIRMKENGWATVFHHKATNNEHLQNIYFDNALEINISYKLSRDFTNLLKPDSVSCGGATGIGYAQPCGIAWYQPRFLVNSLKKKPGTAGEAAIYETTYDYQNARMRFGLAPGALAQRQPLGFEKFISTKVQTGLRSETRFFQKYELAYRPMAEKVSTADGTVLQTREYQYDAEYITATGTRFPRLKSEKNTKYANNQPVSYIQKDFTFDTNGNLTELKDFASDTGNGSDTILTTLSYITDAKTTRLAEKKVLNNSVLTEWTRFTYSTENTSRLADMPSVVERYDNTSDSWLAMSYIYDQNGNPLKITDANGYVTELTYDTLYHTHEIKVLNALGQSREKEYDEEGIKLLATIDENGNRTEYSYDHKYRLSLVKEPGTDWSRQIIYNEAGSVETRYRDNSQTGYRYEKYFFDGLERVYKEVKKGFTNPDTGVAHEIITEYKFHDETKLLAKQSLPYISGKETARFITFEYDSANRLISKTYPDQSSEEISYTTNGLSVTDKNGNTETTEHDARGRVKRRDNINDSGILISRIIYGYWPLSQGIRGENSTWQKTEYDTLNREVNVTGPGSIHYRYLYDKNGNRTGELDLQSGTLKVYTYDKLNRVIKITENGNPNNVTEYFYDNTDTQNGKTRLTSVKDKSGLTRFGYDAHGNITQWQKEIEGTQYAFHVKYDIQKRIKELVYPDGVILENIYSDAGYLQQVRLAGAPVVTYAGPSQDGKFTRHLANGVLSEGSYDIQTHRPVRVTTKLQNGTVARDKSFDFDYSGNILEITDQLNDNFSEAFSYDGLNRLTTASGIYGTLQYAFSQGGNLVKKADRLQDFGGDTNPQAVTSDNMGNTYSYDGAGLPIKRNETTFIHDRTVNQPMQLTRQGRVFAEYVYDFSGLRTIKRERNENNGALKRTTHYLHGLKNYGALYETVKTETNGILHTKYIYGINGERVAQISRQNASLLSLQINTERTLATLYNSSLKGLALSAYHFLNVYLISGKYYVRVMLVLFLVLCSILVYLIASQKKNVFLHTFRQQYVYYTTPVLLVCFLFIFGLQCSEPRPQGSATPAPWLTPPEGSNTGNQGETGSIKNIPNGTGGVPVAGTFFFEADHVGSVVLVTDHLGEKSTEVVYKPYGEIDREHSTGLDHFRYKYTGQEEDQESGLYNYNARLYDPQAGTFISPDTIIPGNGESSQGLNRYMYVEGNPVRWNDPSGHCSFPWTDQGCALSSFWPHSYTGFTKRYPGYAEEPVTSIDEVSRLHDLEYENIAVSNKFLNTRATISDKKKIIEADFNFIWRTGLKLFTGAFAVENFAKAWERGWAAGGEAGWLGALVFDLLYSLTDLLYGIGGIVVFTINILFLGAILIAEKIVEGLEKLFRSPKEWWDDLWDW